MSKNVIIRRTPEEADKGPRTEKREAIPHPFIPGLITGPSHLAGQVHPSAVIVVFV